jgi:hypothetical protein
VHEIVVKRDVVARQPCPYFRAATELTVLQYEATGKMTPFLLLHLSNLLLKMGYLIEML